MQISKLMPVAAAALVTSLVRGICIQEGRASIAQALYGVRVTPQTVALLFTSPLAKTEAHQMMPAIVLGLQVAGFNQKIVTRLVQWNI